MTPLASPSVAALHRRARRAGLQASYIDANDEPQSSSPGALEAALSVLDAARERRGAIGPDIGETIVVRGRNRTPLSLGANWERGSIRHRDEVGNSRVLDVNGQLRRGASGAVLDVGRLGLGIGYHELTIDHSTGPVRHFVMVAPSRLARTANKCGLFQPIYGVRDEHDFGVGSYRSFGTLAQMASTLGIGIVGTTPCYAAFLDEDFDPSPYLPVSRLAWNELFIDVCSIPDLSQSPGARALLDSPGVRAEIARLHDGQRVDYRNAAALQRRILEELAQGVLASEGPRRDALEQFLRAKPHVAAYATFRDGLEQEDSRLRGVTPGYHAYVQFLCDEQLRALTYVAPDVGLYLDFPVGVHPEGFDVATWPGCFVLGAAAGAPPDSFFRDGQNWGFQPLDPEGLRASRYEYLIACYRQVLEFAQALRIDHVMGFERIWMVPDGCSAEDGVYLTYPDAEFRAIALIEAERVGATLVGEDLGTVPRSTARHLERDGLLHSAVYRFEADADHPVPAIARDSMVSFGTHDLARFAAFVEGSDLKEELSSRFDPEELEAARLERARWVAAMRTALDVSAKADPAELYLALMQRMAQQAPRALLLDLGDCLGDSGRENVPGIEDTARNWTHRCAATLEELLGDEAFQEGVRTVTVRRVPVSSGARRLSSLEQVSAFGEGDLYRFNEGSERRGAEKFGAHPLSGGGVRFAVWAPGARHVSVVGDFNGWRREATPLHNLGVSGIWEAFVPAAAPGDVYKYAINTGAGEWILRADPYASFAERSPNTGSVVWDLEYEWGDGKWMEERAVFDARSAAMSIYELHLGSWQRDPGAPDWLPDYADVTPRLIEHVQRGGFTHVEFLPLMEHPFYGSWGYQVTGFFAPTSRYGTPQQLMGMIDALHRAGIGVILDWVPSHFAKDDFALARFDGTALYEHADPGRGIHPDWDSYVFNYSRHEVRSFLGPSADHWMRCYHADGLRVDAVASMLYLDYSRKPGQWSPNRLGGREDLDAVGFLQQLNTGIYVDHPGAQVIAEESTAWPGVSKPVDHGGLGFGFKWDMGWMHDTLEYLEREPVHRRFHHNEITMRGPYVFSENFVLALSHDEVTHGKRSLASKMPGDPWQQLATLRLLLAYQWSQPGKKLLFMGCELGQWREWDHEDEIDWAALSSPPHAGILQLVSDLNARYRSEPALHQLDCEPGGFSWVQVDDANSSTLSYLRTGRDGSMVFVACNFTPLPRDDREYVLPRGGWWTEILNSDATFYGGGGIGNAGGVNATPIEGRADGAAVARITLPPLACVLLRAG